MQFKSNADAALWYESQGYSVIPINGATKKPRCKWSDFQFKRADRKKIKRWWRQWPDAGIGIVTGAISDLDVVDIDDPAEFETIEAMLPESLMCPIVSTPNDGRHLWFKHRDGLVNKARLLKEVDVRTNGGYIIAPPSCNGNGKTYRFHEGLSPDQAPPPAMPEILFDKLRQGNDYYTGTASEKGLSSSYKRYTPDGDGQNPSFDAPDMPDFGADVPDFVNQSDKKVTSSYKGVTNSYKSYNCYKVNPIDKEVTSVTGVTTVTKFINLTEGNRDQELFHIANCLIKGGMQEGKALDLLQIIAANCSPQFPPKEAAEKVYSAIKRSKEAGEAVNIEDVRNYVTTTDGHFTTSEMYQELQLVTAKQKNAARVALKRLTDQGIIEKYGTKNGVYRKIDDDCPEMQLCLDGGDNGSKIWLPFGLNDLVTIMPGNIILVAGEPNSGKTGLLLNMAFENMRNHNVHYFNSEMGQNELSARLKLFKDVPFEMWQKYLHAHERHGDFHDVIKPGEGNINIIDFLEIHDEFYKVGGMLNAIHRKLDGAVAIIALQKNKGQDVGLGGFRTLEKPRLVLAMEPNKVKIVKAKNWCSDTNPNKMEYKYKLAQGHFFSQVRGWHHPEPEDMI
jgi:hypothetical protein